MDETKWRAYRWIADNARGFFWLVWGIGLGGLFAVLLGLTKLPTAFVNVYFTILVAAMTTVFGLASARAMDSISDRRKRRRKFYNMKVRLALLSDAIRRMCEHHKHVEGKPLDTVACQAFIVLAEPLWALTKEPVDLDDLIDDNDDASQAMIIHATFGYFTQSFGWLEGEGRILEIGAIHMAGTKLRGPDTQRPTLEVLRERLRAAIAHFEGKVLG